MKKPLIRNFFYTISLGHVFLGVCLLDWSFNMIRPNESVLASKIMSTVFTDFVFILIGVGLFFAVFFKARDTRIGESLFKIVFSIALILFCIATLMSFFPENGENFSFANFSNLKVYFIWLLPMVGMFFKRKKIERSL
ncbi:MAG: hypothetical protein PHQ52_06680 [Candidatus Omnitrophica bacterium]|nr:hypothetical protein [Candidatus Omnitrophota bacterium]